VLLGDIRIRSLENRRDKKLVKASSIGIRVAAAGSSSVEGSSHKELSKSEMYVDDGSEMFLAKFGMHNASPHQRHRQQVGTCDLADKNHDPQCAVGDNLDQIMHKSARAEAEQKRGMDGVRFAMNGDPYFAVALTHKAIEGGDDNDARGGGRGSEGIGVAIYRVHIDTHAPPQSERQGVKDQQTDHAMTLEQIIPGRAAGRPFKNLVNVYIQMSYMHVLCS
jgi:hypothetical protein